MTKFNYVAGQERFQSLGPIYYRGANGIVLIYDITNRGTFEGVENWIKEAKVNGEKDCACILLGNKLDMEDRRKVR